MAVKRANKTSRAVAPAAEAAASTVSTSKSGGKRILLVDDDAEIVESMRT